jgi:hypothetical protein
MPTLRIECRVRDIDVDTTGEAKAFREKLRTLWAGARGAELGLENPRARIVEVVENEAY